MDDVFIYFVPLPNKVHEMITPCIEGYTIYLNCNDDQQTNEKSLIHALSHISNDDFEKENVQSIESNAHKK